MSRVCNKHGVPEFCPDDTCRWCPPEPETPAIQEKASLLGGLGLDGIFGMKDIYGGIFGGVPAPATAMPPLPIANCLHDGALFDFGSVVSCAACGKILPSKPAAPAAPAAPVMIGHDWSLNAMVCKRCCQSAQQLYGTPGASICKGSGFLGGLP